MCVCARARERAHMYVSRKCITLQAPGNTSFGAIWKFYVSVGSREYQRLESHSKHLIAT